MEAKFASGFQGKNRMPMSDVAQDAGGGRGWWEVKCSRGVVGERIWAKGLLEIQATILNCNTAETAAALLRREERAVWELGPRNKGPDQDQDFFSFLLSKRRDTVMHKFPATRLQAGGQGARELVGSGI